MIEEKKTEPHGNLFQKPRERRYKKGFKLIIYVSAAEMKSLNQDTNDLVIGIYAFYININGFFVLFYFVIYPFCFC